MTSLLKFSEASIVSQQSASVWPQCPSDLHPLGYIFFGNAGHLIDAETFLTGNHGEDAELQRLVYLLHLQRFLRPSGRKEPKSLIRVLRLGHVSANVSLCSC